MPDTVVDRSALTLVTTLTLATLVAGLVPEARAEEVRAMPRPDRFGVAVDVTIGGGAHAGEIAGHARRPAAHGRIGLGLGRGRTAVLVSVLFGSLTDLREPVPAPAVEVSYFDLGIEPSLRHELTRGRGVRVHLRAGWRWRWLVGDTEVERRCSFHGGCDGGFYDQTPTYRASGPVIAVGVGGRTAGDYWAGFGAELAVAHAVVDRPGMDPDLDDVLVTLGLNVALGRGAH